MHEFAMIYRHGPHELTPQQVAERDRRVPAWGREQRARGALVETLPFEGDGVAIAPDRAQSPVPAQQSVAAVTILRAADLDAAIAIAKLHPALDFGTTIEVRRVFPLPVAPLPDRPIAPRGKPL